MKCGYDYLLRVPQEVSKLSEEDIDDLCFHEEECKIVSRLLKILWKTDSRSALLLQLKMEQYHGEKLPRGKLKI